MPRVSHVVASLKRKKRLFRKTKGFWGGRSKLYRTALETFKRSMVFSYRDRRDKKGDFRQLWITRINAACKLNGISYSRFIDGLKKSGVGIDRKILADLAVNDSATFTELTKAAKEALKIAPQASAAKKKEAAPKRKPAKKAKK